MTGVTALLKTFLVGKRSDLEKFSQELTFKAHYGFQGLNVGRYVVLGAVVLGAILTPSTDPLTQSLLAGAVLGLYFGGIGAVKLLGK